MFEKTKKYWEEFGTTTGLYNFSFLFKSKGKIEQFFWLMASAVGIWFTIEDVKNTVETYLDCPTATKIKVFNNETMELSDVTMCVDFDVSRIKSENSGIENTTEVFNFLEENKDLNLYEAFSEEPNGGAIEKRTFTMFSLVLGVLTSIVRAEQMINSDRSYYQWGFPITVNKSGQPRLVDFDTQSSIIIANKWLQSRYNYTKLLQYAGQFLCKMMEVNVLVESYTNDRWENNLTYPCESEYVTWLGYPAQSFTENEVLCLKLKSEYFRYDSPAENTRVALRPAAIYTAKEEIDYNVASYVYLNLHESFLSQKAHNLKYIFFESVLSVDVQLLGDYRSIDTLKDRCDQDSTQLCLMRCRSKYIEEKCHCRPLSFANPSSFNLPTCGYNLGNTGEVFVLPQTRDCMVIGTKYQPNKTCADECKPQCHQLLYGVTMVKDKSLRSDMGLHMKDKSMTIFEVNVEVFKYPLIEEFPLLTAKDFFTSLGGNLSLYLGASFIVILHIFVFFVNIISAETQQLLNKRMNLVKSVEKAPR